MRDTLHHEASIFDERNRRFGNLDGLTIAEQLSFVKEELNGLLPLRKQISSIRVPVLQKAADMKTLPMLRQARNGLAHGGHVLTDLNAISTENDPAELAKLKEGFENLYNLSFDDRRSFTKYHAVVNLANIRGNLLTLDEFKGRDGDIEQCTKLLRSYRDWADKGSDLQTYPFTTGMVAPYHRLMRVYQHSLP